MCGVFLPLLPVSPGLRSSLPTLQHLAARMSVDALQHSPGLRQSVSGAAARFHIAVIGSAFVNRALGLQRGLIFASV